MIEVIEYNSMFDALEKSLGSIYNHKPVACCPTKDAILLMSICDHPDKLNFKHEFSISESTNVMYYLALKKDSNLLQKYFDLKLDNFVNQEIIKDILDNTNDEIFKMVISNVNEIYWNKDNILEPFIDEHIKIINECYPGLFGDIVMAKDKYSMDRLLGLKYDLDIRLLKKLTRNDIEQLVSKDFYQSISNFNDFETI